MLLRKPIFVVIAALLLSGCITTGQVPDKAYTELHQTRITTDNGRTEQLFRQEMERLIKPITPTRYDLSVKIVSSRGDNTMTMTTTYSLYDQTAGKVIVSKSLSSSASIGAVTSEFGEEQAFVHAEERLSISLAQKIHQRLLLFFSQHDTAS